jgi:hypothetical protein
MTGAKKNRPAEKAKSEAREARLAAALKKNLLKRKAQARPRKVQGIGMRGDSVKGKGVDWTVGRGPTGALAEDGGLRRKKQGGRVRPGGRE